MPTKVLILENSAFWISDSSTLVAARTLVEYKMLWFPNLHSNTAATDFSPLTNGWSGLGFSIEESCNKDKNKFFDTSQEENKTHPTANIAAEAILDEFSSLDMLK